MTTNTLESTLHHLQIALRWNKTESTEHSNLSLINCLQITGEIDHQEQGL